MIAPETIPSRRSKEHWPAFLPEGFAKDARPGFLGRFPIVVLALGAVVGIAIGWWVKRR